MGSINLLGVIIAVFVNMGIGYLWYHPAIFGKEWMRLIGKKQKDLKEMRSTAMMSSVIAAIVMALILTAFINFAAAKGFGAGALVGLIAWLGFVASTMLVNYTYANRPSNLFFIDTGYHLVSLIMMGGIIGAFA